MEFNNHERFHFKRSIYSFDGFCKGCLFIRNSIVQQNVWFWWIEPVQVIALSSKSPKRIGMGLENSSKNQKLYLKLKMWNSRHRSKLHFAITPFLKRQYSYLWLPTVSMQLERRWVWKKSCFLSPAVCFRLSMDGSRILRGEGEEDFTLQADILNYNFAIPFTNTLNS